MLLKEITSFKDEFAFLSNFWPAGVVMDGVEYRSVEHAYQAAKTMDPALRSVIAQQVTPGLAKWEAHKLQQRADWEEVRLGIMEELVRDKFHRNPSLGARLLRTGDAYLEEGNHWGDRFWGTVRGKGENHLGKILMKIRSELANEETTWHCC